MESALQVLGIIGYVVVLIILCVVFVCFLFTFIKKQREDKELEKKVDEFLKNMMVQVNVYEKVEEPDIEEKTDIPKEPETKLEDMSIVELRKIAKDLNITYYYKRKKEDLIKAIKAKR